MEPDFTPCDLFICGFLQNQAYRKKCSNVQELKVEVSYQRNLHRSFNDKLRKNVWSKLDYPFDILRATKYSISCKMKLQ